MKGTYSPIRTNTRNIAAHWRPMGSALERDKWQAWRPQHRPQARSTNSA